MPIKEVTQQQDENQSAITADAYIVIYSFCVHLHFDMVWFQHAPSITTQISYNVANVIVHLSSLISKVRMESWWKWKLSIEWVSLREASVCKPPLLYNSCLVYLVANESSSLYLL